jgi:hypothetical protein
MNGYVVAVFDASFRTYTMTSAVCPGCYTLHLDKAEVFPSFAAAKARMDSIPGSSIFPPSATRKGFLDWK